MRPAIEVIFCIRKLATFSDNGRQTTVLTTDKMTTQVQGIILDMLKKKMRQTKEEMEKYKDECDEYQKRLQVEALRREEVSCAERIRFFFLIF